MNHQEGHHVVFRKWNDVHARHAHHALFYFAAQDRRALALVYSEAAQDPEFQADNEAVQQDFASLDHEADGAIR